MISLNQGAIIRPSTAHSSVKRNLDELSAQSSHVYSTSNIASTNLQMKISKFLLRVSAVELPIPGTTDLPLQQLPDTVFGVIGPRPLACHYAPPTCWSRAALHPRSAHRIHPNSTTVPSFCSFLNTQPNLPSSPNLRDHLPCASTTSVLHYLFS